jgi:LysR family transcriptional activator of mexEF-oprN operon
MKHIDFRRIDLNLLLAFDALMSERNVGRAAAVVGVGQPAMSHALSRLRELFDDPLFVRTRQGMEPTSRAQHVATAVHDVLIQVHELVRHKPAFDPGMAAQTLRLGLSDNIEASLVPSLVERLRSEAPRMRVLVRSSNRERALQLLDDDGIDLAIGFLPDSPPWVARERLFVERLVCVFNPRLVAIRGTLTMKQYLAHAHVLVSLREDPTGIADEILARRKLKRTVVLTTPHFLSVPLLLRKQPLISTLPECMARHCASLAGLQISPLPFRSPTYDVSVLWHSRRTHDPANIWLRGLISELVRARENSKARLRA